MSYGIIRKREENKLSWAKLQCKKKNAVYVCVCMGQRRCHQEYQSTLAG